MRFGPLPAQWQSRGFLMKKHAFVNPQRRVVGLPLGGGEHPPPPPLRRGRRAVRACVSMLGSHQAIDDHEPGTRCSLPDHQGMTPRDAARMGPYPRLCLALLKEAERVNLLHKVGGSFRACTICMN